MFLRQTFALLCRYKLYYRSVTYQQIQNKNENKPRVCAVQPEVPENVSGATDMYQLQHTFCTLSQALQFSAPSLPPPIQNTFLTPLCACFSCPPICPKFGWCSRHIAFRWIWTWESWCNSSPGEVQLSSRGKGIRWQRPAICWLHVLQESRHQSSFLS